MPGLLDASLDAPAEGRTDLEEARVHPLIEKRWSPRAFSPRAVPRPQVHLLLEAARWAASSMNEQPWAFVVADKAGNPEGHAAVVSTLMEQNAVWASKAPLLLVATARTAFSRNGAPNRWAFYDLGAAVTQMILQGEAMGLAAHQMAGFDVEKARHTLHIPEGYEPVAVIAIGYPGDPETLPEALRARELAPRSRRPAAEWTHSGEWGSPFFPAPAR